ncbi:thaumatin [Schizophyllum amplum]|uniref:Thaumatin n=1 Tax=Schizophyllum amplum TaxID=97359 RepID=A0A550CHY3_9AGAR|nr:thaumatin [Auriculariopsis ampla]
MQSFAVLSALIAVATARTFTVTNNCAFTIWPGLFTDLNAGTVVPDHPTGWEQAAGETVSFQVPEGWTAGRIWGRTNCDFSTNPGPLSCETGGCNGGLECDRSSGTGVPPASVAEWTLDAGDAQDWYDVSLVDGFNLPMAVTMTAADCHVASCPTDLNPGCPAELQQVGADGSIVGCKSACFANLDGNQADSANCCSGSHNTADTCPPEGVQYYDYFKDGCNDSYVYAYDESSESALWTCPDSNAADYTLTFCP